MNFTSKETYIAARADWKAKYNTLSQEIRKTRRDFNLACSVSAKTPSSELYWEAIRNVQQLRITRSNQISTARNMLTELAEAKKEAARQWAAVHVKTQLESVA